MKALLKIRALKIAFLLFLICALAYAVHVVLSIGRDFSGQLRQPQGAFESAVEAVIYFPSQFLPPPGERNYDVHILVCSVWVFSLLYAVSLVYSFIVPAPPKGDVDPPKEPPPRETGDDGPGIWMWYIGAFSAFGCFRAAWDMRTQKIAVLAGIIGLLCVTLAVKGLRKVKRERKRRG